MKLYLSHSSAYDYKVELYNPLKSGLAEFDIFFPHESDDNGVNSKAIISNSDLMIAEVSYPSTGQGIEIGWANASNVPIICIYRSGMGPSGALRFISNQIVEYSSPDDMVAKLRSIIADHA